MSHWRYPEPPDWSQYATRLRQMWHNPKWCRSIFVDDAPVPGVAQTQTQSQTHGNLHSRLQRIVARACSVCDPQAQRPFPSDAALTKHVTGQHHHHLCSVCLDVSTSESAPVPAASVMIVSGFLEQHFVLDLHCVCSHVLALTAFQLATVFTAKWSVSADQREADVSLCVRERIIRSVVLLQARRSFPLELPVFASQKELQAHVATAHTFCGFCNIHFFSGEELWEHMHDRHFTCQLCVRHGSHSHFNAAQDLTEHLRYPLSSLLPARCCLSTGSSGHLLMRKARVGLDPGVEHHTTCMLVMQQSGVSCCHALQA